MAESLLGQPSGVRQKVVIHKYQRGLERFIKSKLSRIRYKISVGDESEIIVPLITGKLACSQRPLRDHPEFGSYNPLPVRAKPLVVKWVARIKEMKFRSVICLLEDRQLDRYYVRGGLNLHQGGLLGYYKSEDFQVRHFPLTDYQRPQERSMQNVLAAYHELLKPVLLHCSAGIDRTTPVAAFILQQEMHSLLLLPPDMPPIQEIQIPQELYWILRDPVPLAGMFYPSTSTPWRDMKATGFSHVICLTDNRPQYDPTPLTIAHAVKLEDLSHGEPPQNPKKEEHLIRQAVSAVAGKFFAGEGRKMV